MKFSAKKFSQNASAICKKLIPESHRRVLDGMEVIDGQIDYEVDGEEYYLYPVELEWCEEDG